MKFVVWMRGALLGALMLIALVGCGAPPVAFTEIPLPAGITQLEPGQNTLADTLGSTLKDALGDRGEVELKLYSVPATLQWDAITAFYAEKLGQGDWKPADELSQDSDVFKTTGWLRGGLASEQGLAVGYAPDMLGDGAFMMVALFSE